MLLVLRGSKVSGFRAFGALARKDGEVGKAAGTGLRV